MSQQQQKKGNKYWKGSNIFKKKLNQSPKLNRLKHWISQKNYRYLCKVWERNNSLQVITCNHATIVISFIRQLKPPTISQLHIKWENEVSEIGWRCIYRKDTYIYIYYYKFIDPYIWLSPVKFKKWKKLFREEDEENRCLIFLLISWVLSEIVIDLRYGLVPLRFFLS